MFKHSVLLSNIDIKKMSSIIKGNRVVRKDNYFLLFGALFMVFQGSKFGTLSTSYD